MSKTAALLLGNGINNIDNPYTWSDLVRDLIAYVEGADHIRAGNKLSGSPPK